MHCAIDGNEANVEHKVGVSWYVYKLLQQFAKIASKNDSFTIFLREKPREDMPEESTYFHYAIVPGKNVWSQVFLPLALYTQYRTIDVFFSPAHYAPRFCPVPLVVALHDLSYFYYPSDFLKSDLYKLEHWTRYSVKRATHVIAVSQTTKKDAIRQYNLKDDKITVVPNGFEPPGMQLTTLPSFSHYFAYIGTLQPRKNLETLLHAFSNVHAKYPQYTLRIIGKKGWMFDHVFRIIESLKLTNSVLFTGYVDEQEKYSVITNATALIVPGLYEGFGLPMLEAFHTKTPVIAANSGALPEIGKDVATYFELIDHVDLSEKMIDVIEHGKVKIQIARAYELVKEYTWELTARRILTILKKATYFH
ncbi:MAG: glycosyltransferase family 4 protein [Candidatus Roizmanbacteria bacterium]|nr:glycosyltransferase family 4 protein [Candidatus Roizmanbacteria bacterium]